MVDWLARDLANPPASSLPCWLWMAPRTSSHSSNAHSQGPCVPLQPEEGTDIHSSLAVQRAAAVHRANTAWAWMAPWG